MRELLIYRNLPSSADVLVYCNTLCLYLHPFEPYWKFFKLLSTIEKRTKLSIDLQRARFFCTLKLLADPTVSTRPGTSYQIEIHFAFVIHLYLLFSFVKLVEA